jgi:hypothetical protein
LGDVPRECALESTRLKQTKRGLKMNETCVGLVEKEKKK